MLLIVSTYVFPRDLTFGALFLGATIHSSCKKKYSILVSEILSFILRFFAPVILYVSYSISTNKSGTHILKKNSLLFPSLPQFLSSAHTVFLLSAPSPSLPIPHAAARPPSPLHAAGSPPPRARDALPCPAASRPRVRRRCRASLSELASPPGTSLPPSSWPRSGRNGGLPPSSVQIQVLAGAGPTAEAGAGLAARAGANQAAGASLAVGAGVDLMAGERTLLSLLPFSCSDGADLLG